ncbi:MAG: hypothetical protein HY300_11995 [Verrucomicrobia bacterium]|nr:hypothetical protein [Verrucomicrobiota bacterium]
MQTPLPIRIVIWLWLIAAIAAGNYLWLQRLPMPAVQGVLFGLTALVLLVYFKTTALRAWISSLDLRALVLLHVTRFVGIYFLILYRRGELPYAFAVPGGWGDITVATLALLVCFVPMKDATRRRAITIWNVIGFVDILMVVVTAGRLGFANPAEMRALTYLPLSLLPTFLVPLIIATHVILYSRLQRAVATE